MIVLTDAGPSAILALVAASPMGHGGMALHLTVNDANALEWPPLRIINGCFQHGRGQAVAKAFGMRMMHESRDTDVLEGENFGDQGIRRWRYSAPPVLLYSRSAQCVCPARKQAQREHMYQDEKALSWVM